MTLISLTLCIIIIISVLPKGRSFTANSGNSAQRQVFPVNGWVGARGGSTGPLVPAAYWGVASLFVAWLAACGGCA